MDWCKSDSLKLIALYKQHECLWNPNDDYYKNKNKKNDAWNEISGAMKCDPTEIKKKIESMLGSFRRERLKQDNSLSAGSGVKSTWFAFKHMLFLLDKFAPRETKNIDAGCEESSDIDQELDELEFISTQQAASTNTQQSEPPATKVSKNKRAKKLHKSSIGHKSKKQVAVNISNPRSEEAYQILKDTVANRNLRDASTIFGEYVALKHRKYSAHTQSVVEHLFANILYNADMGTYEPDVATIVPTSLHSSTMEDQQSASTAAVSPNFFESSNHSCDSQKPLVSFINTFSSDQ